jgi:hypothetical protein
MGQQQLASSRALRLTAIGATAALFFAASPQAVSAAPATACEARSNNSYQKLLDCVTLEGVREH